MKKIHSNKRISDETLFNIALCYEFYEDFIREERSKYTILSKRKLLDIACKHMTKKDTNGKNHPNFKHDYNSLNKKAKECKTIKEFRKKYPSEYITAHNLSIFYEITAHMEKSNPAGENHTNTKYTNKEMFEIALKCKTISDLIEKHYDVYCASRTRGIYKEITAHMPELIGENHPLAKYKNSEIIKKGSIYRTPYQFLMNDPNTFKIAWKRKLLEKINFPDGLYINSSAMEKELFNIINNIVGNAKKFKDRKVKIDSKPYIKGFDIDIFISDLNLGIEVDGAWWHSFECMRKQKGKKLWSDEDIHNYHEIKDAWFATKGIKIIHIKEEDWLEDKQACIDRCLEFLGIDQRKAA